MIININDIKNDKGDISELFTAKSTNDATNKKVGDIPGIFSKAYVRGKTSEEATLTYGKNPENLIEEKTERYEDAASTETKQALDALEKLKDIITPEGYSQAEELGITADSEDLKTLVTVQERIQIELAMYCEDYDITGLSISKQDIEAYAGNKALAMNMAAEVFDKLPTNEGAKSYLISNKLEPTIKNTYVALHSSNHGIENQKIVTDEEWNKLEPQAMKVYEEAGLIDKATTPEVKEEYMKEARSLLEKNIPLTAENAQRLAQINSIMSEENVKNIGIAIDNSVKIGMKAEDTRMGTDGDPIIAAYEAEKALNEATTEDLNYIVTNNNKLTIDAIKQAQIAKQNEESINNTSIAKQNEDNVKNSNITTQNREKSISYMRVVVEARAVMTSAVLVKMQLIGININATELDTLVEEARNIEKNYSQVFFEKAEYSADKIEQGIFSETINELSFIKKTMQGVGESFYAKLMVEQSVASASNEGNESFIEKTLHSTYEIALQTYEAVGTEVRPDLGDRISRAFDRVDSLLETLGYEITEANRKAARILGYNSMELSEENMQKVKSYALEVDTLVKNLTPVTTAYLIKEGVNPLDTEISKLNAILEEINEKIEMEEVNASKISHKEVMKYSEYLYKLDMKGELTDEERAEYIGMYRLLNWVTKNDANVVGALFNQGAEVNLRNLLSAARSKKVRGIDITLDEKFGLTEEVIKKVDIDAELSPMSTGTNIEEYTKKLLDKAFEDITPNGTKEVLNQPQVGEVGAEKLAELMMAEAEEEKIYAKNQVEDIKRAVITEGELKSILNHEMPLNMSHILAAGYVWSSGSRLYKKLQEKLDIKDLDKEILKETEKELQKDIEEINENIEEEVQNMVRESSVTAQELREMMQLSDAFSFIHKLSEKRQYLIPAEIDGEEVSIHLSIDEGAENSRVMISTNHKEYGEIKADIQTYEGKAVGIISVSEDAGVRRFSEKKAELENADISISLEIVKAGSRESYDIKGDIKTTDDEYLYNIAKTVIRWMSTVS